MNIFESLIFKVSKFQGDDMIQIMRVLIFKMYYIILHVQINYWWHDSKVFISSSKGNFLKYICSLVLQLLNTNEEKDEKQKYEI